MERNIKCCQILGPVAGSYGTSKLRVFAHACAVSALSISKFLCHVLSISDLL